MHGRRSIGSAGMDMDLSRPACGCPYAHACMHAGWASLVRCRPGAPRTIIILGHGHGHGHGTQQPQDVCICSCCYILPYASMHAAAARTVPACMSICVYMYTDQVQATVKDYSYICTTYVGLVEGLVHVYTYYAYVCMHGNIWTPASHITGRPRPTPPRSTRHMFHSWLANQSKGIRNLICVGVVAVYCWAI